MQSKATKQNISAKTFSDLDLDDDLIIALTALGLVDLTPIQSKAIPAIRTGKDLIGIAETGTGKTAAFSLPVLHQLLQNPVETPVPKTTRALILAPTRELAQQIAENIRAYAAHIPLKTTLLYGGVPAKSQIKSLERGVDLVIATPGRLLDLFNDDKLWLGKVEHFILDEADRMLDMGFIRDIQRIASQLPKKRQTLLFSATFPRSIAALAETLLDDPVKVQVAKPAKVTDRVKHFLLKVPKDRKRSLLDHLLKGPDLKKVLIFTRTIHGANKLFKFLTKLEIETAVIHGNKAQNTRKKAIELFKSGSVRILVATDIAARGIDIEDITHVINYDIPTDPDSYIHRIGRTGRAKGRGIAYTFLSENDEKHLTAIERLIKYKIPVEKNHPF